MINYNIAVRLGKFQKRCGATNCVFRNKIHCKTKLKFYKVMGVSILLYGSEL